MTLVELLNTRAIDVVNDIRANLGATGTNATVKTSQSLQYQIVQNGDKFKMVITGRPFFMTVETGRKPTPSKKPSRQMISNIQEWLEARSLNPEAAWAIAMSINNKGSALWRKGGRKDIVSNVIGPEFIDSIEKEILQVTGDNYLKKFLDDLKNRKDVTIRNS